MSVAGRKLFQFGPRRSKRLFLWLVLFFAVPLLYLLPFPFVKPLLFLPALMWVNIIGIPLAMLGVPYFEIHEFGAVPLGMAGYLIIAGVYLAAAFFLSLLGKSED